MKKIGYLILSLGLLCSCSGKEKKSEAAQHRAAWIESFSDSTAAIRSEMEQINNNIINYQTNINSLLPYFEVIDNPKFVEKYSVYKGWKNYDTGAKTGVLLRLCENSSLEFIATLQGGYFDKITVTVAGETLSSAVVPYDKALNYRIGNTNIVGFKGSEIDSICQLISMNKNSDVKLTCVGKTVQKTIILTKEQKDMIDATYKLWSCNNNINKGNLRLQLLAEKLKIFENRIQQYNSQQTNSANHE